MKPLDPDMMAGLAKAPAHATELTAAERRRDARDHFIHHLIDRSDVDITRIVGIAEEFEHAVFGLSGREVELEKALADTKGMLQALERWVNDAWIVTYEHDAAGKLIAVLTRKSLTKASDAAEDPTSSSYGQSDVQVFWVTRPLRDLPEGIVPGWAFRFLTKQGYRFAPAVDNKFAWRLHHPVDGAMSSFGEGCTDMNAAYRSAWAHLQREWPTPRCPWHFDEAHNIVADRPLTGQEAADALNALHTWQRMNGIGKSIPKDGGRAHATEQPNVSWPPKTVDDLRGWFGVDLGPATGDELLQIKPQWKAGIKEPGIRDAVTNEPIADERLLDLLKNHLGAAGYVFVKENPEPELFTWKAPSGRGQNAVGQSLAKTILEALKHKLAY